MEKVGDYIRRIEIASLWSGKKHIVWDLDRSVNILSGVNGVGKSTILKKVVTQLVNGTKEDGAEGPDVKLTYEPADADTVRFDVVHSFDRPLLHGAVLENLTVFPDVMLENIYRTRGVIFAQRVMNALIGKGLSREQAYDTVQPIAMQAMSERRDYQELLRESPEVMRYLTPEELDGCFTLDYYMKNVDYIYNRAGVK